MMKIIYIFSLLALSACGAGNVADIEDWDDDRGYDYNDDRHYDHDHDRDRYDRRNNRHWWWRS